MAAGNAEKRIRVLIIDDDPGIIKVISLILETRGFETTEAKDGISGIEIAKRENPDVILLDIMMPELDGYEVIKRLKRDPDTWSIPVVFVTAKTTTEAMEMGTSLGASGYLTKPFHPEDLIAMIKEATKQS
ncbi:MAG: response regulator [Actinomycetota bacterium]|nr:response regulator [Actinomycetota bacterium]